jgi:hypothetical protein
VQDKIINLLGKSCNPQGCALKSNTQCCVLKSKTSRKGGVKKEGNLEVKSWVFMGDFKIEKDIGEWNHWISWSMDEIRENGRNVIEG